MLENEKISGHQLRVMMILTFIGVSILNTPGVLAGKTKQDAWITAILGVAVGLLFVWLYSSLANMMQNMTLINFTNKLLGKWLGTIISVSFVIFLLLNTSAVVWIVGNFMATQVMPETPIGYINLLFVGALVIASRLGLEVIARSAEIFYPWVIGGFIVLTLFLLPNIEINNIKPVFNSGLRPMMHGVLLFESFTSLTFVVFLVIFPYCVNIAMHRGKLFVYGYLIAGTMIILLTTISILVLGPEITSRNAFPSYTLAKKISIGKIFERIEAVVGMVWIISIFFKAVIYFYGLVLSFAQTLQLKDVKSLTLPLGIIILTLSQVVYPNSTYAAEWDSTTWISYVIINGLIFPLLLLIVGKIKKRGKNHT